MIRAKKRTKKKPVKGDVIDITLVDEKKLSAVFRYFTARFDGSQNHR